MSLNKLMDDRQVEITTTSLKVTVWNQLFALILRDLREIHRCTQQHIADLFCVDRGVVVAAESPSTINRLTLKQLRELLLIYGMDVEPVFIYENEDLFTQQLSSHFAGVVIHFMLNRSTTRPRKLRHVSDLEHAGWFSTSKTLDSIRQIGRYDSDREKYASIEKVTGLSAESVVPMFFSDMKIIHLSLEDVQIISLALGAQLGLKIEIRSKT